ncbi:LIC12162 family transferase [Candidatus Pelagibacter sp. Uisw_127]|uniref:LIC12162 family transferase n=1 Tax=Candidatus Pelagibacter sp. Uisw_127 TaxID=3230988 RepID=UPI0039EA218C
MSKITKVATKKKLFLLPEIDFFPLDKINKDFFFSEKLNKTQKKNIIKNQIIFKKFLKKLSKELNKIHNVNYSERFWNILMGHWLEAYINTIYRQYTNIKYCIDHKYKKKNIVKIKNFNFTIHGTEDFYWITNNYDWNQKIFIHINNKLNKNKISEKKIDISSKNFEIKKNPIKYRFKFRSYLKIIYNYICEVFTSNYEPLIIGTCLNKVDDFFLKLNFSILPKYWLNRNFIRVKKDKKMREMFKSAFKYKNKNILEGILCNLIHENIPTCLLEGFKKNLSHAKSLPWPKHPKFIFTSNNFCTDEIFKLYTAMRCEENIKYFVGQHGNIYGTHLEAKNITEIVTSDKFLSWGWKDDKKIIPTYMFSKSKTKIAKSNNDKILFIVKPHLHNIITYNIYGNMIFKLKKNIELINNLDDEIKKKISIRILPSQTKPEFKNFFIKNNLFFLDQEYYFQKYIKNIRFDRRNIKLEDTFKDYGLIIHSYDGTSFNETMYHNIPSLGIWYSKLDNYNVNTKKIYKDLQKNKVIHFNNNSIIKFLNNKENQDILSWWNNEKVKKSINNYQKNYANNNIQNIKLSKILNKLI